MKRFVRTWRTADDTWLAMRPMRKDDAPLIKQALNALSPEARYNRFFTNIREFTDEMVASLVPVDIRTHYALIVVRREKTGETPVAGGRFIHGGDGHRCEFSVLIGDSWQGFGIGHRIMDALIAEAIRRRMHRMVGYVLADNRKMLRLARSHGFVVTNEETEPGVKQVCLDLTELPIAQG